MPSDEDTDYTLLEVVYNAYKGLNTEVYTVESAQAFVTALEAVNDIITSKNAGQEQADAAVSRLISAAACLQYATATYWQVSGMLDFTRDYKGRNRVLHGFYTV